jgi:hypothetical protein
MTLLTNSSLLGCLAVYTCKQLPKFRRRCACSLMLCAPQSVCNYLPVETAKHPCIHACQNVELMVSKDGSVSYELTICKHYSHKKYL